MSDDEDKFEDALDEIIAQKGSAEAPASGDPTEEPPLEEVAELANFDPSKALQGSRFEGLSIADDAIVNDVKKGEDLFLTNKFEEAKALFEPYAKTSMYHALGYSTILAVRAVMTMEQEDIQAAFKQLKITVHIASKYRKKGSMFGWMKGGHDKLSSLTKEELHAELTYAEATLMKAEILFFVEDGIMAFIKGGISIKHAYGIYKNCLKFVEKLDSEGTLASSTLANKHFVSGIYFGMGTFNLVLSLFPAKLMKLFEFVGFNTSRELGLKLLEKGGALQGSLRGPLCDLSLLVFHSFLGGMFQLPDCEMGKADAILQKDLQQFPNGAVFLFFEGKINQGKKLIRAALESYNQAVKAEIVWKQLHHICYWENTWNHALLLQWDDAAHFAGLLLEENKWSRSFYAYQQAAFLMTLNDPKHQAKIEQLLESVPKNKQKIAGKSIPIEKFVVRKTRQYFNQGKFLLLPALEILYVWGYIRLFGESLSDTLALIEKTLKEIAAKGKYDNVVDDTCLCNLLKGCLKREEGDFTAAEECFNSVIQSEKTIHLDHYLLPFARMELGRLFIDMDRLQEAKDQLESTKKYKKFSMETILAFRVHLLTAEVEKRML